MTEVVRNAYDEYVVCFSQLKDDTLHYPSLSCQKGFLQLMQTTEQQLYELCEWTSLPPVRIVELKKSIEKGLSLLEASVSAMIHERRCEIEDRLKEWPDNNGVEVFGDYDYPFSEGPDLPGFCDVVDYPMNLDEADDAQDRWHRVRELAAALGGREALGFLSTPVGRRIPDVDIELCFETTPDACDTQSALDVELDFSDRSGDLDRRMANFTIDFEAFASHYGGQNIPDITIAL